MDNMSKRSFLPIAEFAVLSKFFETPQKAGSKPTEAVLPKDGSVPIPSALGWLDG